jgi:hypothetical protein
VIERLRAKEVKVTAPANPLRQLHYPSANGGAPAVE